MTTYYYEFDDLFGDVSVPLQSLEAPDDMTAVVNATEDAIKCGYELLVVYKKNPDAPDETPFTIVFEKE